MNISNDNWRRVLADILGSNSYRQLSEFIDNEYSERQVFPPYNLIFNALELTSPEDVKVVILGQDPYPRVGQAMGLAFSTREKKLPKSLNNIYKEILREYPVTTFCGGDLSCWAKQGVLLLNTTLTVAEGLRNSHRDCGWKAVTRAVIDYLNTREGIVFMLWGNDAINMIPKDSRGAGNLYLTTSHPSPLSACRGFIGCNHFRECNDFLGNIGKGTIDWSVE